jgi:hypothetical protein
LGETGNDDDPAVGFLIYDGLNNMCDGYEGKQDAEKVGCANVRTEVPLRQWDGES